METVNSPIFLKFGNAKDHQTLLNFAILAGKWQKRIFSYKIVCKKFHGRAKGGASHRAPPKYATGCWFGADQNGLVCMVCKCLGCMAVCMASMMVIGYLCRP